MAPAKVVWSHGFPPLRAMLASHIAQLYTARVTIAVGLKGKQRVNESVVATVVRPTHCPVSYRQQVHVKRQPREQSTVSQGYLKYTKPMLLLMGGNRSMGVESPWLWQSPDTRMSASRASRYGSGFLKNTWSVHAEWCRLASPKPEQP